MCCPYSAWSGSPNSGSGCASAFFVCPRDPFPFTGLPHPALIEGFCLVSLHLAVLCSVNITGRPAPFWKRTGRAVDLEVGGEGSRAGRSGGN